MPFGQGKAEKEIFVLLADPLIRVLVRQIVVLESQLVPILPSPVTYFPTNLVYPFTLRVTGIKMFQASFRGWLGWVS